jgi:quinol-cytochrome oxidoreductase complex cytochrome b subunit
LLNLTLKNNILQNSKTSKKNIVYWYFITCFILLTWLGIKPIEHPYLFLSSLLTLIYFFWYFI